MLLNSTSSANCRIPCPNCIFQRPSKRRTADRWQKKDSEVTCWWDGGQPQVPSKMKQPLLFGNGLLDTLNFMRSPCAFFVLALVQWTCVKTRTVLNLESPCVPEGSEESESSRFTLISGVHHASHPPIFQRNSTPQNAFQELLSVRRQAIPQANWGDVVAKI